MPGLIRLIPTDAGPQGPTSVRESPKTPVSQEVLSYAATTTIKILAGSRSVVALAVASPLIAHVTTSTSLEVRSTQSALASESATQIADVVLANVPDLSIPLEELTGVDLSALLRLGLNVLAGSTGSALPTNDLLARPTVESEPSPMQEIPPEMSVKEITRRSISDGRVDIEWTHSAGGSRTGTTVGRRLGAMAFDLFNRHAGGSGFARYGPGVRRNNEYRPTPGPFDTGSVGAG